MEMFHPDVLNDRLRDLKKSEAIEHLEHVEKYALEQITKLGIEHSYDVIANEPPYFKTMGYTEFARNFMFQPLSLAFRDKMIDDAFYESSDKQLDFAEFLRNNIKEKTVNKYQDRKSDFENFPARDYIVVLPGSNKIKEHVCLNKLKHIAKKHKGNVWFKPHPVCNFATIGELQDIFKENILLPRDIDLYHYLYKAKKVYTTHLSESAIYGVALGIPIEPIDVHHIIHKSSFYSLNRILFDNQNLGDEVINRILSNYKSGIINPIIDKNWKKTLNKFLDYSQKYRNNHKEWYIIKEKQEKKPCKDCE